jgi:hypothetical protein
VFGHGNVQLVICFNQREHRVRVRSGILSIHVRLYAFLCRPGSVGEFLYQVIRQQFGLSGRLHCLNQKSSCGLGLLYPAY